MRFSLLSEDYPTGKITNNNPIDTTYSETSYARNFLNASDLKYMQEHKNRTGKIVQMSPNEYYRICGKDIFKCGAESLKRQRANDPDIIENLINVLTVEKKQLPLPYIDYHTGNQEGLHRMMAIGEVYGWDFKVPVLVITTIDERVAELDNIWRYWNNAIYDAEQYTYDKATWEEDFVEEVQDTLNKDCDKHYTVVITDRRTKEECEKYNLDYAIEICIKEFEDIMHPYTVFEPQFRTERDDDREYTPVDVDDIDWDDLDIDDLLDELSIKNKNK